MKISMMPTKSSDSPERKETTTLFKSSSVEPLIIQDFQEQKNQLSEERQESTESENDERCESKVNVRTNAKTDGTTKEGGETSKLTRSKRISCQDTIHEAEEDDGLTMDRVGK